MVKCFVLKLCLCLSGPLCENAHKYRQCSKARPRVSFIQRRWSLLDQLCSGCLLLHSYKSGAAEQIRLLPDQYTRSQLPNGPSLWFPLSLSGKFDHFAITAHQTRIRCLMRKYIQRISSDYWEGQRNHIS